jgi:hypothetical protein
MTGRPAPTGSTMASRSATGIGVFEPCSRLSTSGGRGCVSRVARQRFVGPQLPCDWVTIDGHFWCLSGQAAH